MKLYGLQKMTLLDYPGHVACTVFTGGCDFRCPFCHNFDLACSKAEPVMEEEAFWQFLEKRKGLLDGIAITGGEPCLQPDLESFMKKGRQMGFAIKLDTNGYHPQRLRRLAEQWLVDYVAMDIKNSPGKYAATAGLTEERFDFGRIAESISFLMEGKVDYEFRTTIVSELHEAADLEWIGRRIAGAGRYFLQSFVDREQVPYAGFHAPSAQEMDAMLRIVRPYVPDAKVRGI